MAAFLIEETWIRLGKRRLGIHGNLRARPEALSNARLSWVGWGQGVLQQRFRLKSPPDLCGHLILQWNARAPRAERCQVWAADRPGGASPSAFARCPPWSSPSKRSALGAVMALGLGRSAALASPRSPVSLRAAGRLPAHCALAAIPEDWRSSVSGQRWPVIFGI
jgi:hypothetical protein